ncbi:ligand-binding sensor domain-containing protein [Polluticoccus soli]|uniref:ligand-binding sensor domain-containing protein n=1 Tax=Polluticoccus soli TaxID=3034150 RepID=UPI0023E1EF82|nr:sensor histidine kinase [Flavipsychrobacter sp. JY13-12]
MSGNYLKQSIYRVLVVMAVLVLPAVAHAQRFPFFNLNVENGLIQSQATSMVQDRYGHLWIGTLGGLSRYDGKGFVNYSVRDGMLNNTVNTLATDKDGNLWIGGPKGLSEFNGKRFKHYIFESPDNVASSTVSEIKISDDNTVWFRAAGRLYGIIKGKVKYFQLPDRNAATTAIQPDGKTLWVAKSPGVIYRLLNNKWDSTAFAEPGMTVQPTAYEIFRDSHKQIWFTTNAGLYQLKGGRPVVVSYHGTPTYFLPPVGSIAESRTGDLWLGTNSGAIRIRDSAVQFYNKRNGLSDNSISAIMTDAEGNVWLASDGQGVFRFSGSFFTVLDEGMGLPSAQVMSIAATSNERLYIGTYDAGLFLYQNGTVYAIELPLKPAPAITAIKTRQGKKGSELWFGTRGAGLWKYNGATFSSFGVPTLPSNSVTALYTDTGNRLYIGFVNGAMFFNGVNFYSLGLRNTSVMDFKLIGEDSLLLATTDGIKLWHDSTVTDFVTKTIADNVAAQCFALRGDELWIGSSDNGIAVYNLKTKKAFVINKNDGLQSDFIYNIVTDNDNNVWVGTGYGIHKISIKQGKPVISFYGKNQGVAGMESNHNAVQKMPDGSIWFGTTNGALHYKPQSRIITPRPLSVVLQSVKVFGENIIDSTYYTSKDHWYGVPQRLRLPPNKNNVTFTFQAISMSGLEQVRYRYKMDGLDAPWSEWSAENTVTFSALPPGNYTLHVAAVAGDSEIKELKYSFEIITPFHKTGWFKLAVLVACILLGVLIQYIVNRRKQNRLALMERLRREEQAKVRQRTAEDFHDEIGNKLTRINVLTNVLREKIPNPTSDTKRILEQIQENTGQLYSGTRDILWSLKPTNDNLYEILHRVRDFGVELFQDTDIDFIFIGTDERWKRYKLPLDMSRNLIMIFKEALNNALKYSDAKQVKLEAFLKDDNVLQMVLTDNGKGFDIHNFKKGHGIDNMKVRAKRVHGILYMDSRPEKGTIINLNFRLPPKDK